VVADGLEKRLSHGFLHLIRPILACLPDRTGYFD
jgi:hypothetical protein